MENKKAIGNQEDYKEQNRCLSYFNELFQREVDERIEEQAKKGDEYAQYVMAWCCLNQGNREDAIRWAERAASQDDLHGMCLLLGLCYTDDVSELDPWEISERARLVRKSHEELAILMNSLADLYYKGIGVERDLEKATRLATHCAMEYDDETAQHLLSVRYMNGDGVERDVEQAVFWGRKAADHGNIDGMNLLTSLLTTSDCMVFVNLSEE